MLAPKGEPCVVQKSGQRHFTLKIRINEREDEAFRQAAAIAGLDVSPWARMKLREAIPEAFKPEEGQNPNIPRKS